jgi:hypothetical protein
MATLDDVMRELAEIKGLLSPRRAAMTAVGKPANLPNYGKSKGAAIATASLEDLNYYLRGCDMTLANPEKQQWHDRERSLRQALVDEIERRKGSPAAASTEEPW